MIDTEIEKLAVKAAIPITDEILERGFYSLGFKAGYKAALLHKAEQPVESDAVEFLLWMTGDMFINPNDENPQEQAQIHYKLYKQSL